MTDRFGKTLPFLLVLVAVACSLTFMLDASSYMKQRAISAIWFWLTVTIGYCLWRAWKRTTR